jgi:hypothetical protein
VADARDTGGFRKMSLSSNDDSMSLRRYRARARPCIDVFPSAWVAARYCLPR